MRAVVQLGSMRKSWLIMVLLAIELFIFSRYQAHDAGIHFFLHSLAAVTIVFSVATMFILLGKKIRGLVYAAFLLHQYAMIPDYLYSLGYVHKFWMNIFLGHLWLDGLPHHDIILPIVSSLAIIGYLLVNNSRKHILTM